VAQEGVGKRCRKLLRKLLANVAFFPAFHLLSGPLSSVFQKQIQQSEKFITLEINVELRHRIPRGFSVFLSFSVPELETRGKSLRAIQSSRNGDGYHPGYRGVTDIHGVTAE